MALADRAAPKDGGWPGNPDDFFPCPTQPTLGLPLLPQVHLVNISLLAGSLEEGSVCSRVRVWHGGWAATESAVAGRGRRS